MDYPHILQGCVPNYLDMTTEFDRDDISTLDNGFSYSNSALILINSGTRSYPGSVMCSISWNIIHAAEPVKRMPLKSMTIVERMYQHLHRDLSLVIMLIFTSTPGPNNEYIYIHQPNEFSINKLNSVRINLMIRLQA